MKKLNRKLTEKENSSQCNFNADHSWKDENELAGIRDVLPKKN